MSSPPSKRPKLSRNKKANQRKIDVSSIQDAVLEKEAEIRAHGQPVSEKADHELFKVDKVAMKSSEIVDTFKQVKKTAAQSKKDRYKNKLSMIDKILKPDTSKNVKPVKGDISHIKKQQEDQAKDFDKKINKKNHPSPKVYKTAKKSGSYDLWDENERKDTFSVNLPKKIDAGGSFNGTKKYTKKSAKMTSKNFGTDIDNKMKILTELTEDGATRADVLKKNLPHPGQSYQPDVIEHQNLLKKEHEKIVLEKEKNAKIDRIVAWDRNNVATAESDFKERAQGLFEEEDDWEDEDAAEQPNKMQVDIVDSDEENEDKPNKSKSHKPDDNIPKSAKAKQRVKLDLIKQKEIARLKQKRRDEANIFNAKRLIKEMAQTKEKNEATRIKNLIAQSNKFPRLSSTKFTEIDEELKLTDEIKPSLRQLVPEGSILADRYNNMVRRGVVEPHTTHKGKYKKKYKTKLRVKRSVKNCLGIEGLNDL